MLKMTEQRALTDPELFCYFQAMTTTLHKHTQDLFFNNNMFKTFHIISSQYWYIPDQFSLKINTCMAYGS